MKKTSILSTIFAGSLAVFGAFGCSHDNPPPNGPNTISGQATTPSGDTTVNPPASTMGTTGTATSPTYPSTTTPSTTTPTNDGTLDQRQPVRGTTKDLNGNMPNGPSDTTAKPDTNKPDTNPPDSTIPNK